MNLAKSAFCVVLFVMTLLVGSASFVAGSGPPNACLMVPELQNGQGKAPNDYQPESCIT